MKILRHLKRLKTDIALLQETHLSTPDFHRMKKLWVGTVLGSDSNGRKAGVSILIHKNLPCMVLSVETDSQGRLISAHIQLGTKDLIVSYAPNNPTKQFFSELSTWLLHDPHLPHIIGRDFNSTIHLIEDRSTPKRPHSPPDPDTHTLLASTKDFLHLHDIWHLRHPADREFTFYSNPHNVFTRTDYLFCSDDLIPLISDADIHDISDHAPISTTLIYTRIPKYGDSHPTFTITLTSDITWKMLGLNIPQPMHCTLTTLILSGKQAKPSLEDV